MFCDKLWLNMTNVVGLTVLKAGLGVCSQNITVMMHMVCWLR